MERYRIKYGRYPPQAEVKDWHVGDEWRKRSLRLFRRIDANRDGNLSEREWSEATRLFSGIDANRDGRISSAEVTAAHAERFRTADRNGDGRITKAEWKVNVRGGSSESGGQ
jgi:hypothetical protein